MSRGGARGVRMRGSLGDSAVAFTSAADTRDKEVIDTGQQRRRQLSNVDSKHSLTFLDLIVLTQLTPMICGVMRRKLVRHRVGDGGGRLGLTAETSRNGIMISAEGDAQQSIGAALVRLGACLH
ncbi:hypothetical protein LZ32DRAFT_111869 [Colletotrichum eremochloae]|nr:hypothetical protein LZ32DRAFT_111869 [Colletotrichum eremochloae]